MARRKCRQEREYAEGTVSLGPWQLVVTGVQQGWDLFAVGALFVLEHTFHNAGGAQASDNGKNTITDFLRNRQGRR